MTPPSLPGRYRKKPVVIEAMQFQNDVSRRALIDFLADGFTITGSHLIIHTLEGDMRADLGDWIIKGVKGEFYPIKDSIFCETYEPAD